MLPCDGGYVFTQDQIKNSNGGPHIQYLNELTYHLHCIFFEVSANHKQKLHIESHNGHHGITTTVGSTSTYAILTQWYYTGICRSFLHLSQYSF